MTNVRPATRREMLDAPHAIISPELRKAYRTRRHDQSLMSLCAASGFPSPNRLSQVLLDLFRATDEALARLALVAAALGLKGKGPFHRIVPPEVIALREERERLALLPPSPRRKA